MLFLSHSSKDKPLVRFFADDLYACGHEHWLDERQLFPGDPLTSSLSKAIVTSNKMILFLSRESVHSKWIEYEIKVASQLQKEKNQSVLIPCLIGDIRDDELPLFVLDTVYVDFRTPADYEKNIKRLLATIAIPGTQLQLPIFDSHRSDRYISRIIDESVKVWLAKFLIGSIHEHSDQTERYWMYITLAEIGGQDVIAFMEGARQHEDGLFAKRGVKEASQMLGLLGT